MVELVRIVVAILDDTLPNYVTLFDLAVDPPRLWKEQRALSGLRNREQSRTGVPPFHGQSL